MGFRSMRETRATSQPGRRRSARMNGHPAEKF
jgi:hypothetical protein